mmetsp:Transcript_13329/g.19056  ORF Transcript_13329/g.19056 Transcript_13329/m.19056 type:complete len:84 (-) Transcript_13329:31-282(-)
MPSVRTIGTWAFGECRGLCDVECGQDLETLEAHAFKCPKLKRIVLPLKDNMVEDNAFYNSPNFVTVDLVGGIHSTVGSLYMES